MATIKLHETPVLDPAKTTILVIGATGFIAANIIREALDIGYSVRGTARDQEKAEKTVKLFDSPRYSCVLIPDFREATPEIDEAMKGVDAVCLPATDLSYGTDPDTIVPGVVKGVTNVLKAAAKSSSVKRFVLTSAVATATTPYSNKEIDVTPNTWNEEALDAAWNKRDQPLGANIYPWVVYTASKIEGERAMWKFMEEEKPGFVANSVLPNFNIGRALTNFTKTSMLIIATYQNGYKDIFPPQWYINVTDDARLHLAAAVLDGSLANERIFATGGRFTWNEILETMKKIRPNKTGLELGADQGVDMTKMPNELGATLLKKWFGQDGYQDLEYSIKEALEGVE